MAFRSYGHNSTQDWDPMQEDFSNSNYDPQYPDDSSNDQVKLDHCRLYITNIPKALNDEGLRAAFMKYGSISEVFVSKNPVKRYGMVAFETPAEARHAMMKLNKTEPLKLNISIAHEKKKDNHVVAGRSVTNTGRSVSNTGHSVSNTGRSTITREQCATGGGGGRDRADIGYEARWKSTSNRYLAE